MFTLKYHANLHVSLRVQLAAHAALENLLGSPPHYLFAISLAHKRSVSLLGSVYYEPIIYSVQTARIKHHARYNYTLVENFYSYTCPPLRLHVYTCIVV